MSTRVELWGIPTCGSTRKARRILDELGVDYVYKDLREVAVPKALLRDMLAAVSEPRRVFNTSGASYRDGGWSARVAGLSKDEIVAALKADPMLIKRPVIRGAAGVLVGLDEDAIRGMGE